MTIGVNQEPGFLQYTTKISTKVMTKLSTFCVFVCYNVSVEIIQRLRGNWPFLHL